MPFPSFTAARLAAALSCCSCCGLALAQPDIVVTGTREPLAQERLAADVIVIDAETMRGSSADSLADLLRREAGVQISRSGGPGQSSGLLIRGTASQQSVVLVDGVRVGSATLGYAALENLGLASLARVEVLRGPGSSLYGADAVGGVVNLITRRGAPGLQGDARLAWGGYGSREAAAGLRGGDARWDWGLTLANEGSRGVSALHPGDEFGNYNPDRDGYRLDSLQARAGLRPAAGQRVAISLLRTRLETQYDGSEFLPPDYAPDSSPDFRTRVATTVAALDWRGEFPAGLRGSARASRSVDEASNGATQRDHYRTVRQQFGAQLAWQAGALGQLVAALERLDEDAASTNYVGDVGRRTTAAVLELTGTRSLWSWQADVRRDDSSDYGAVDTARLGGSVALAPGLRLRALAGNTFRAPSFNDLYFPGYGVSTLRPERGQSIEVGLNWSVGRTEASATVYRNRVRDLIGYESDRSRCPADPAYGYGCAANVSRAELQGATLAGRQRSGAWTWKAQLDFLQARDRDTGARLQRRAAHQGTLGAEWTRGDWTAAASALRLGARPDGGRRLAAETTLDLSAGWRATPRSTLQVKLLNASDREREPVRDYQGLGRQVWLVWRYETT